MARALIDVSPAQYLVDEELSQERHEYNDGQVYLKASGTVGHCAVTGNLLVQLKPHLEDTACFALAFNMRLHVAQANCYFYPDIVLCCDAVAATTSSLESARVVVEVYSAESFCYDQGKKFTAYRQLDSLQEYVLIDSESRNVSVYRRAEHGDWIFHAYTRDETVRLASIDFIVSLTELYDDTGIEE